MTVYVDDVQHNFGRMIMCHLWADTDEELLDMVKKIGVQAKWIQGHPTLSFGKHKKASWVHFDISMTKKKLAIHHGAVLTDRYGPVIHTSNLMLKWAEANNRKEIAESCRRKIAMIEGLRLKYAPAQGSLL